MKGVAFWFLLMGVLYVIIGMCYGIWMSIQQDFTTAPAHAHLNLIGFVLGSVFAYYYHLFPNAGAKIRWAHFWIHQGAVVLMFPGIIIAITSGDETLVKIGSLLALASAVIFAYVHVTASRSAA